MIAGFSAKADEGLAGLLAEPPKKVYEKIETSRSDQDRNFASSERVRT